MQENINKILDEELGNIYPFDNAEHFRRALQNTQTRLEIKFSYIKSQTLKEVEERIMKIESWENERGAGIDFGREDVLAVLQALKVD